VRRTVQRVLWGTVLAALVQVAAGAAEPVLAAYFGNSLLCKDETTGAVCHLWLDADGSYFLMYDRGVQQQLPTVGGNFRLEGRRGHYSLQGRGAATRLCLRPEPSSQKHYAIEAGHELFAGASCYGLAAGKHVGDTWEQVDAGRTYKLWLVRGRG
jgi:hypothetical protein